MGIIDRLTEARLGYAPGERARLLASIEHHQAELQEALSDVSRQLAAEDRGWRRLGENQGAEFDADARRKNALLCRDMAVMDPLIKRGLALRASFVWGKGVGITAEAAGEHAEQDLNAVVQDFLDDPGNRATLTGHQARLDNETALGTDGNRFLAHFTDPRTGAVQVRAVPFDQVTRIVTNPDDAAEPWFYLREWAQEDTLNGATSTVQRKAWYPALGYRPKVRHRRIDGTEVMWDAPIYHVRVNGLADWAWGVGDVLASIPWVRAYGAFLRDWARLMASLAKVAYQVTAKDRKGAQAARAALQQGMNSGPGGAMAFGGDLKMEAVSKSGATIDSESAKPLAVMVAAGLGLPVTLLTGDPGSTGARAVAETLDGPMVTEMSNRREIWTEQLRATLNYVIDQAVIAPLGPLRGTVRRVSPTRTTVDLAGDTERTLTFEWPRLDEVTEQDMISMVTEANGTGLVPAEVTARLLLRALGVRDVDELIDTMRDSDGVFIPPDQALSDALTAARDRGERE